MSETVRLEHVNLVVKELEPTLEFLLTAFPDWYVRGRGESEWFGVPRRWLHVGTHDYYLTLNNNAEGDNRNLKSVTPGLAHIGFVVENLDNLVKRMEERGYRMAIQGGEHPHRRNAYYHDPAGFEFEFVEYLSEKPSERHQYGGELSNPIRF